MENQIFNGHSLKIVREFYGLSQSQFAKNLKISQPSMSKLEKGEKMLEEEIVQEFSEHFTSNFFKKNYENLNPKLFYRKLASINKSTSSLFESRLNLLYNTISEGLEIVDLDSDLLPKIDAEEFNLDFEYIATEIRLHFGIGKQPIDNIVKLLEDKGIVIHFFDYNFISVENKKFDGVSFYVKGIPVIMINNKIPNSRKVFTIAHELGHLIMHFDDIISIERDIETEANNFAAAFLAPAKEIKPLLRKLTFEKLVELKIEWNMSIAALVYRAYSLGNITNQTLRWWMMKLAPYRKSEPQEFELESPLLLKTMFQVLMKETESEFFKNLGFTEKLKVELFGKELFPENKVKLKIVL